MCVGLDVKYPLFLSNFKESSILWTDCVKSSNIQLHKNPSTGNRVVPCRQTHRRRDTIRTDTAKLPVPSRNFANEPKNWKNYLQAKQKSLKSKLPFILELWTAERLRSQSRN